LLLCYRPSTLSEQSSATAENRLNLQVKSLSSKAGSRCIATVTLRKNLPQSPQFSIENCGDCGKFLPDRTAALAVVLR